MQCGPLMCCNTFLDRFWAQVFTREQHGLAHTQDTLLHSTPVVLRAAQCRQCHGRLFTHVSHINMHHNDRLQTETNTAQEVRQTQHTQRPTNLSQVSQ
jgi:hypothetical protein